MTIIKGWIDFAIKEPGPPNRRNKWDNTLENIYHHSLEGVRRRDFSVLTHSDYFPLSWTGTVARDGTVYQHYPVEAGLNHGGPLINPYGPGFEAEGGGPNFPDETLTEAQIHSFTLIHQAMREYTGRNYRRDPKARYRLMEHREASATECPRHRYDVLWERIEDLTEAEIRALLKKMKDEGELAGSNEVLSCVEQIVGVKPNTYSDKARVEKAREGIKKLVTPERVTTVKGS